MNKYFTSGCSYDISVIAKPELDELHFVPIIFNASPFTLNRVSDTQYWTEDDVQYFSFDRERVRYKFKATETSGRWIFFQETSFAFEKLKSLEGQECYIFYNPLERIIQFTRVNIPDSIPLINEPLTGFDNKYLAFENVTKFRLKGNRFYVDTDDFHIEFRVSNSKFAETYLVMVVELRG